MPIPENSQIFDVDIVFGRDALISIESVLEKFPFWVNMVDYDVCVKLMAGSKYCNFKMLVRELEKLFSLRPNIETWLQLSSRLHRDRKENI